MENAKENKAISRNKIFESEREFKKAVSIALSDFRRNTNGRIVKIKIQYLDDGSGKFITHIISILPDYSNTVIDSSFNSQKTYDNFEDLTDEEG